MLKKFNSKKENRRTFFKRAIKVLTILMVFLILLITCTSIYEFIASSSAKEDYPPPGKLINVGKYNLHLHKQGQGAPTIIFESGSGAPSSYWKEIAEKLSPNATVITYDRAGYSWSDEHVTERTGENIVEELHTALEKADMEKPYILVGHSIGGLYTRLFAQNYSSDVAGMVLLDARSENFSKRSDYLLEEAGLNPESFGTTPVNLVKALKTTGLLRIFKKPILGTYFNNEEELDQAVNLMFTTKMQNAIQEENEKLYLVEEQVQNQELDNIPLTVIAKGIRSDLTGMGLSKAASEKYEDIWREEQEKLASLSSNSKFLVAMKSGHDIAINEPQLVVNEINEMIARVKNNHN